MCRRKIRDQLQKVVGPISPVERMFGLEEFRVGAGFHALADRGGRIVDPSPIADDELGNLAQRDGKGGVSAIHARKCESMLLTNDGVRALLVVCRQVATHERIAGLTVISGDPGAFRKEREPRKPAHVGLVGRPSWELLRWRR